MKKIWILIICLVILAAIVIGFVVLSNRDPKEPAADALSEEELSEETWEYESAANVPDDEPFIPPEDDGVTNDSNMEEEPFTPLEITEDEGIVLEGDFGEAGG